MQSLSTPSHASPEGLPERSQGPQVPNSPVPLQRIAPRAHWPTPASEGSPA
ncbi:MAG: hypothetical protein U0326_24185 [Polyangiales bacterium]